MQALIRKKQVFLITLLTGITLLNPASADNKESQDWIQIGRSEELKEISIKNIRKLGNKEFSYQNKDNTIILVKCDDEKILVRYWYFTKIENTNHRESTRKMQWHRAAPKSQTETESEFVCDYS